MLCFKQMNERRKRWTVLVLVSVVMAMGYVFWDIVSPISTSLKASLEEGGMGWSAAEYGFYAGSYSIFNIFLLMLFFGGVILDKCGIRFTGLLATGVMLLGAIINYAALTMVSPLLETDVSFTLFGLIPGHLKTQVLVASLGFGLFGMGCDITGITVSKIITKWFIGHELASAMGLQVAMARLGTASALSFSPLIAQGFGLSASLLAGAGVLLFGFVLFVIYTFYDRHFDREQAARRTGRIAGSAVSIDAKSETKEDSFRLRDICVILRNPGFWLLALLCVSFYSSIRPFMKFATDLMINTFGVAETTAGWLVAAIPYGTIVLTPLFGTLYDRYGHGARLMLGGSVLLLVADLLLAFPLSHSAAYALVIMLFVGIAFSLVPSAFWPSVPKLVPLAQLGTAYSIIYFVQNIGLMLVPVWIGGIVDRHTVRSDDGLSSLHVDYTIPMVVFAVISLLAVATSLTLLLSDGTKKAGLEQANMNQQ